jgi:hypothetical protein
MEIVGIFYDHLVYFTAIWYIPIVAISFILGLFGIFFPCWYVLQEKSGITGLDQNRL